MRWALGPAPGPRVLDLGAGTGKLTATLVPLGAGVIAVKPDPAMPTGVLRSRRLCGVSRQPGPAGMDGGGHSWEFPSRGYL